MEINSVKKWLGTGSINIFGRPFAGKDTQGKILADLFNGTLLGGGDILRGSVIPDHVKKLLDAGFLAPTEDYINIVLPYLRQEAFKGRPLILSSVGRWHGEEEGVLNAANEAGHELKAVIYLSLEEDFVRSRWEAQDHTTSRGHRADDTREVLEIRLKEFREKTLPVIEYYRQRGLLIEIDGTQSVDAVTKQIVNALADLV